MKHLLESYKTRARVEGHRRLWAYLFGTLMLPKIGLQVKYLFESKSRAPGAAAVPDGEFEFSVARSLGDLTAADIAALKEFEGQRLVDRFAVEFEAGNRCCISRFRAAGLTSACWIANAPQHLQEPGKKTLLIRDCFTLPRSRGRGLYPRVLDLCLQEAFAGAPEHGVRVVISSVYSNRSSLRGIEKAGFARLGMVIQLHHWGLARLRVDGRKAFRFFTS